MPEAEKAPLERRKCGEVTVEIASNQSNSM